ncbi:hypothetical protein PsorP6_012848 [Peronosclerospora sorghi]|uniref:Uncharacterized protein n=1 Tax=Peronosclerospora sorghi TaxID=230839 RepID=A0ACC0WH39_9STRA|nr:hypothetical protein PsorP6_012848 [Peronosclerospora sorghi]
MIRDVQPSKSKAVQALLSSMKRGFSSADDDASGTGAVVIKVEMRLRPFCGLYGPWLHQKRFISRPASKLTSLPNWSVALVSRSRTMVNALILSLRALTSAHFKSGTKLATAAAKAAQDGEEATIHIS